MITEREMMDDLLVLWRRGPLSEPDQRRLREAVAAAPENEVLYAAGRAFDLEAPVMAGDDARIERILQKVEKRPVPLRPARSGRRMLQALAVGMLLAGVAAAAVGTSRWLLSANDHESAAGTNVATQTSGASEVLRAPTPAESTAGEVRSPASEQGVVPERAEGPASPQASAPIRPERAGTSGSSAAVPVQPPSDVGSGRARFDDAPQSEPPATTSRELFAAANRARVQGDTAGAIAQLQKLEVQFPNSSEGVTAHLSLGMLYLKAGSARAALDEFRVYRRVGASSTMPEAIWGEAQAVRQLGRSAEERAVLEELLSKYPRSAYAAAAQKRLAELH